MYGSSMSREMLSPADREIRLGIWKIHILFRAAQRDVWGTWLLEELAEHEHQLSPGTLYPAVARMERNGWLERKGNAAHARARHVFRTTSEGRRLLSWRWGSPTCRCSRREHGGFVRLGRSLRRPSVSPVSGSALARP